jgi:hypothetical protein
MSTTIHITDASLRTEIELAITELRRKQHRMPAAWVDRRAEVGDEIDELVDMWLEAEA